jgi:hypothetical protein
MPDTFPASIRTKPRGGQPSNRNAFKHGLYSGKNPTPLADIAASIKRSRKKLDKSPAAYGQVIREMQEHFCLAMNYRNKAENLRSPWALDKIMAGTLKTIGCLKHARFKQQLPMLNLGFVSHHTLEIIHLYICDLGITRDADSFRDRFEKSDFNSTIFRESLGDLPSDPIYPFITPRQWRVLEPLLPPPVHNSRRGRPPTDPRELLDAVFWKFAHHARWRELPDYYPPIQACRRYYRRLFKSGRLTTLYSALYEDLVSRQEVDLPQFVQKNCFSITHNKLVLHPKLVDVWQMRTALLFLQLGYRAFCHAAREIKLKRQLGFTSCRMLCVEPGINPPLIRYPGSSSTPGDLAGPGPGGR